MKKNKIKIFVSHPFGEKNYETIKDDIYVNVLSGAVFDKNLAHDSMVKDNIGNNISHKNKEYNELTVQYLAWKNYKNLDYYGLCHYRRYMSFSEKKYEFGLSEHDLGLVNVDKLSDKVIEEHHLNYSDINKNITDYDVICMQPVSLKKYGIAKTNYLCMKKLPHWHFIKDVDLALEIIKENYHQFYKAADYYFNKSDDLYLYNCWIMSKKFFNMFCEFQFGVLSKLESKIDISLYSKQQSRVFGLIGERLFGVFITYLKMNKMAKIKHNQIILIRNPDKVPSLKPAFAKNNVAIAIVCSNYYIPYFSALLESIKQSTTANNNYDLIVLHKDIQSSNIELLTKTIKNYKNISLRFYDVSKLICNANFHVSYQFYSEITYYRIFTPWIMTEYEKVITLDSDTLFKKDPSILFNEDIDDYLLAACKDYVFIGDYNSKIGGASQYNKSVLKLKKPMNYINTGVLLLNLKKFRKSFSFDEILYKAQHNNFLIQEQDLINVLVQGKCKFLSVNWNYYIIPNQLLNNYITHTPKIYYEEYVNAKENPYVIHFANRPKPWDVPSIQLGYEFWNFAKNTPYYEECLYRMFLNLASTNNLKKQNKIKQLCRKIGRKIFPKGSRRRNFAKKIIPPNSKLYNFLIKIIR